jgi:hypothetical protein
MVLTLAQDEYPEVAQPCVDWLAAWAETGEGELSSETSGEKQGSGQRSVNGNGSDGNEKAVRAEEECRDVLGAGIGAGVGNGKSGGGDDGRGEDWWAGVEGCRGPLVIDEEVGDCLPLVEGLGEDVVLCAPSDLAAHADGGGRDLGVPGQHQQQNQQECHHQQQREAREAQQHKEHLMKALLLQMCDNMLPSLKLGEAEGTMAAKRITTALLCAGEVG